VPARPLTRWILYALSFGLLWGLVADALIFGDDALSAVIRGAVAGALFATIGVWRETGGLRGRRRRRRR
jgi:drug/metabolite transporter (DMT)-like permease